MTLLNLFSSCARMGSGDAQSDDRGVTLMLVLLLGLVFVPIIGLHIAAVVVALEGAASPPDNLAQQITAPAKHTRG